MIVSIQKVFIAINIKLYFHECSQSVATNGVRKVARFS